VAGDCLLLFIPHSEILASSLFRPRRNILAVFDGVFLLDFRLRLRNLHMMIRGAALHTHIEATSTSRQPWLLQQSVGTLQTDAMSGTIDVAHPERGLLDLRLQERPMDGKRLIICRNEQSAARPTWPLALAETYVRDDDLVASYSSSSDWPYFPQIYWTANSLNDVDGVIASIAILCSVQTHLLDTWPQVEIASEIAASEIRVLQFENSQAIRDEIVVGEHTLAPKGSVCCVVWQSTAQPTAYAEFMPISDFRAVEFVRSDSGAIQVRWKLFAEFLEKGVIRRSRLQSIYLHREKYLQTVAACCELILRGDLPLTT